MTTQLQGTKPGIATVTPHPLAGGLHKVQPMRLSLGLPIALFAGWLLWSGQLPL
ncbi:hypothetical protein [Pseudomonas sp. R151218B TE3479]